MNKFVLLASAAAVALACGTAGAVTLTNSDKTAASVKVEVVGGKTSVIKLKTGESYDSNGKEVKFSLHGQKAVDAKGTAKLEIKGGKVEEEKTAKAETKPEPKKEAAKPAEKPATPAEAKPAAGGDTKPADTQEKK